MYLTFFNLLGGVRLEALGSGHSKGQVSEKLTQRDRFMSKLICGPYRVWQIKKS